MQHWDGTGDTCLRKVGHRLSDVVQGPIALNQFPTGNRTPDNPLAKDSTAQAKLYNMTERIISDINQKRHGSRTAEQ